MFGKHPLLVASLDAIQNECILIIDNRANVFYANDAYCRTVGFPRESILGKPLLDIRPRAKIVKVLDHQYSELQVLRETRSDDVLCNLYPIMQDNQVIGAISVSRSISSVISSADFIHRFYHDAKKLTAPVKDVQKVQTTFEDIIAQDPASIRMLELAKKIATKSIDVLLTGESGTGKERYAQAIHSISSRREHNFVAVNCATLRDNLMESELFGYEDGAFTGGKRGGKSGIFEIAHGGTIFLDEISELDYNMQSRLLRVLQERKIRRIGGTREVPADVRIIAATNTSLEESVKQGLFRKDLYYRISPFILDLLPLRQRRGDILPMIRSFLSEHENERRGRIDITPMAQQLLLQHHWDGNVRELRNAIDHAVVMMSGSVIDIQDLPRSISGASQNEGAQPVSLKERVAAFERQEILRALLIYGDTVEGKKQAAQMLGISLASLYKKLEL